METFIPTERDKNGKSRTKSGLLEAFEYNELIEIAKAQQLSAAVAKIDEFNELHDALIREVQKENIILEKKRKLSALKCKINSSIG